MELQFHSSCVFALLWIELHLLEIPMLKPQVLRRLDLEITLVRRWLRVDGVIRWGCDRRGLATFWEWPEITLLPLPGTRHTGHPSTSLDKSPHPKSSFAGPLILNSGLQDGDEHTAPRPWHSVNSPSRLINKAFGCFLLPSCFPKCTNPCPTSMEVLSRTSEPHQSTPFSPQICRRSKALSPWIPDLGKICRNLLHSEGKF